MIRWWRRRRARARDELVCREFVELVTDYLEGALPEGERLRFEAHLSECDGCSGYLEDMHRLVRSLGEIDLAPNTVIDGTVIIGADTNGTSAACDTNNYPTYTYDQAGWVDPDPLGAISGATTPIGIGVNISP